MNHALTFQAAASTFLSWPLLIRLIKSPLLLLTLSAGLLLGLFPSVSEHAMASSVEAQAIIGFADGTYVFGESPEAGQVGSTYMVFEVQSQSLVGAFYQPSSSFDCFHGQVEDNKMTLTVIDSYDQTSHPYVLALDVASQAASQVGIAGSIVPSGFYSLSDLSELDWSILATCQTNQAH